MPVDPIIIQRRLTQLGRIRLGEVVKPKNGKPYPGKLDKFRITSPYRWAADAVAAVYGGDVRAFDNELTDDRWEVYTDASELDPVIVLPSLIPGESAVSQWFEQWTKGGCSHRCTGTVAYKVAGKDYPNGIACDGKHGTCTPDDDGKRACTIKTRLSVVLPQVVGTGQWRLDTGSWNAATEMGGISDWLVQATAAGYSIPATLSLQQVTRRAYVKGEPTTRRFVMPVLIAKVSQQATVEIERGGAYTPELDGFTPAEITPRLPLALAAGHPDTPPPRVKGGRRRTVDTVVPPTGVEPETAAEARDAERVEVSGQDQREARTAWFESLPFSPEDVEIEDMFALCAQRVGAGYDDTPDLIRDRVKRGLDQIESGELVIDAVEGELRLVRFSDGEIVLRVAVEEPT